MQSKDQAGTGRMSWSMAAIVAALGIAAGGCGPSTTLQGSWKDPSFTGPPLKNILMVAAVPDGSARRTAEDIVVGDLKSKGVQATSSYTLFPDGMPTVDQMKEVVAKNGYDGVIVSRLTSKEKQEYYVPPTVTTVGAPGYGYGGWYGWYGGVYSSYVSPGYVGTETVVLVDTSVWSTAGGEKGKMIWTGTTESIDPKSAQSITQQISNTILPKLKAAGVM
ncbi:MAG: hypothetical protein ACREOU_16970 [Candidatus Eiseniibacteriota bacterium]|jgi:hypothetical protein